jgi:hypothetical protein
LIALFVAGFAGALAFALLCALLTNFLTSFDLVITPRADCLVFFIVSIDKTELFESPNRNLDLFFAILSNN